MLEPKTLRAKLNRPGTKVSLAFVHRIAAPDPGKHKLGGKGLVETLPSTSTTLSSSTTTTVPSTTTTLPDPCANGVQDGNETAVDCGGGTCPGCADGEDCLVGTDCLSTFCSGGTCTDPCATEPAGTSCADDGNGCTVDECDGSTCQHTPAGSGAVCRPAAGPCDTPETCDGTAAPCPADQLLSGGTCRAADGDCDVAEECDGVNAECPSDGFMPAGVTCRGASGVCDQVEECTGTTAACPDDAFLGTETVCRATSGDCDEQERCTGRSALCSDDFVKQAGTVCRPSTGGGDATELCDGIHVDCPPDVPTTTSTSTSTSTSTTTSTLVVGCFEDWGDGTIRDTCTTLQWEKKTNDASLHAVGAHYTWSGCCNGDCSSIANLCQPNAAAAATCAAETAPGSVGCAVCEGGATCVVDPQQWGGIATTLFDWLNQLNDSTFAGYDDWRLPDDSGDAVGELRSIVEEPYSPQSTCPSPCIDDIFGPTVPDLYVAHSPPADASPQAAYVIFDSGPNGGGFWGLTSKTSPFAARAVRETECIPNRGCIVGEDCGTLPDGCGGTKNCGEKRGACFPGECGVFFANACTGDVDCGGCVGASCDGETPCAFGLVCGPDGVCGDRLGGRCRTNADCGEGTCSCTSGIQICDGITCQCDSGGGRCLASLNEPCSGDGDCYDGLVCNPTSGVCKKALGEVCFPKCAFNASIEYPNPLLCSVWIDEQNGCDSGCFKNTLDPANATTFGSPVCCVGLDEPCEDDADCCKGNFGFGLAGPNPAGFRPRHCGEDIGTGLKTCKRLSLTGEECQTTDDCLKADDVCENAVCKSTAVVHLRKGEVCVPGDAQRVCDVDPGTGQALQCTNCTPENQGYRCIPRVVGGGGCCDNGNVDKEFCGSWPRKCCGWECTDITIDEDNCGDCGDIYSCDLLAQDPWVAACHFPPVCQSDPFGFDNGCYLQPKCQSTQGNPLVCVPEGNFECVVGNENGVCCFPGVTLEFFTQATNIGSYEGLEVKAACFSDAGCSDGKKCVKSCGSSVSSSLYGTSCSSQGVCLEDQ